MTERVYPKLPDDKMNSMMDKQKALREKTSALQKDWEQVVMCEYSIKIYYRYFFVMYTMWSIDTYYDSF